MGTARAWDFTPLLDSQVAGIIQIKWNTITGKAFHSDGTTTSGNENGSWTTWYDVLTHAGWVEIQPPVEGFKPLPKGVMDYENRFVILPHVMFENKHGVFMVDSYFGSTYVLTRPNTNPDTDKFIDATPLFPYHDLFTRCYWTKIQEAQEAAGTFSPDVKKTHGSEYSSIPLPESGINRYRLSASNASHVLVTPEGVNLGAYGPWITRIDTFSGRTDMALKRTEIDDGSEVDYIWYPMYEITFTDPPQGSGMRPLTIPETF
jgi:hypothetical protein